MQLLEILKNVPHAFGIRLEDEPSFTVSIDEGDIQIREYESFGAVLTHSPGPYAAAREANFRLLYSFISSRRIPMTSPVIQKFEGGMWHMAFVLPPGMTAEDVEPPRSTGGIVIEQVPAHCAAALCYGGHTDERIMKQKQESLLRWLESRHWLAVSTPRHALYDPPYTIPFLKRNEVLVTVQNGMRLRDFH